MYSVFNYVIIIIVQAHTIFRNGTMEKKKQEGLFGIFEHDMKSNEVCPSVP